jgi:hypothetical protein
MLTNLLPERKNFMIFVFGSNRSGIHGAGAAKTALEKHGAIWGIGEGLAGSSYALPTKGFKIEKISILEVQNHVDNFLEFAVVHPNAEFQVTRVGCGLGGHKDADIAPLFREATNNCLFDEYWKPWLDTKSVKRRYWGTF